MTDRARWWTAVAVAIGLALVGGSAVGFAAARSGRPPVSTLVPLAEDPTTPPPTSAAPTRSATPSPRPAATRSRTPSPTPTPTPKPTPTPSRTPSPSPTPSPTPIPRTDVAYVTVQNTFTETVEVQINGVRWTLLRGRSVDVEVVPAPNLNDGVSVTWVAYPACGQGDADHYFDAGKHYRVLVRPEAGCQRDNQTVAGPQFTVQPA
ncbi:MAG: hypothetical protein QOE45_2429 [Frankiaceae bacterium]|jgi:hypothetical protein|nr:hypothetical protein [Frankiaceae bacterium]